jgi:hypothetical protein
MIFATFLRPKSEPLHGKPLTNDETYQSTVTNFEMSGLWLNQREIVRILGRSHSSSPAQRLQGMIQKQFCPFCWQPALLRVRQKSPCQRAYLMLGITEMAFDYFVAGCSSDGGIQIPSATASAVEVKARSRFHPSISDAPLANVALNF